MADLSEVSKNAKKIKEQIAEKAGVAPEEVNDASLQEAQKTLEGAGQVSAKGADPTQVPVGQLKQLATGEPDKSKPEEQSNHQKIAMAIAAIAPVLLGYAAGGNEGGAIGAQAGLGFIKDVSAQEKEKEKNARDFAEKKQLKQMELEGKATEGKASREKDLALAKERSEDRKMQFAATSGSREMADMLRKEQIDKLRQEAEDKTSIEGKLKKLNSGDKQRLDNTKLGLEYTQAMDDALSSGDNTFSLIGDNKFTNSLSLAAEAFGRMQSGGAINKQEEARFMAMSPRPSDPKDIQREKLVRMQKLFADRMGTLGFTPQDLGLEVKPIQYAAKQTQAGSPLENNANAAPAAPDFESMSKEELKKYLGK